MENVQHKQEDDIPQRKNLLFATVKGVLIGGAIGAGATLFTDATSNNSIKWKEVVRGDFSNYDSRLSKRIYPLAVLAAAAFGGYHGVRDAIKNNREAEKAADRHPSHSFVASEQERRSAKTIEQGRV